MQTQIRSLSWISTVCFISIYCDAVKMRFKHFSLRRFFVSERVPGVGGFNRVCRMAGCAVRGLRMVPTQTGE